MLRRERDRLLEEVPRMIQRLRSYTARSSDTALALSASQVQASAHLTTRCVDCPGTVSAPSRRQWRLRLHVGDE